MSEVFSLNHGRLDDDPHGRVLAKVLGRYTLIDSGEAFNRYCRTAIRLWNEEFSKTSEVPSARFKECLGRIEQQMDATIATAWGGVVVTLHEHPRVEKYLVVRRGGYLALERHAEKDEYLEVLEGSGLLLSRIATESSLTVEVLQPNHQYHFEPGQEHCLIGTENLLVFERSTDPKGMDQDLIFLYEPDAFAS